MGIVQDVVSKGRVDAVVLNRLLRVELGVGVAHALVREIRRKSTTQNQHNILVLSIDTIDRRVEERLTLH